MLEAPLVRRGMACLVLVTGLAAPLSAQTPLPAETVVFLTTGSSWTVPYDWNSSANIIEVIGGGGGGDGGGGGGGGGGAYSEISGLTLTPGATVTYQVGAGGQGGTFRPSNVPGGPGGDTWFDGASCSGSLVCAKGGASGIGGAAANGVGTTKFSGGNGGGSPWVGGGGGGGAAGPNGNGANGASGAPRGATNSSGGGGGGGNGGGTAAVQPSGSASQGTASAGGNSGNGSSGGAAGTVGTVPASNGASGSQGSGGGGGAGSGTATPPEGVGGAGGNGVEWDISHGSGGGGGGGGGSVSTGGNGGNGGAAGLYGAGGGGGGDDSGTETSVGGNGAPGIIIIRYTPHYTIAAPFIARTPLAIPSGATWNASGTLANLAANLGFYFGDLVYSAELNGNDADKGDDLQKIRDNFSLISPGTVWDGDVIHPNPPGSANEYNFTLAEQMVMYAQSQGQTAFATAAYGGSWANSYAGNGPALQQILVNSITTEMQHFVQRFPGAIRSWNVVQEPFDHNANPPSLSWSMWSAIGSDPTDYMVLAAQTAHRMDATAKLCVNDFPDGFTELTNGFTYGGTTYNNMTHWDLDYLLIQILQSRGAPIDCLQVEMHTGVFDDGTGHGTSYQNYVTNLPTAPGGRTLHEEFKRFAAIGVEIEVSEADFGFTVDVLPIDQYDTAHYNTADTQWQTELQACIDASNCTVFNLWEYSDRYSDYGILSGQPRILTPYNAADIGTPGVQLNWTPVYNTLLSTLQAAQPH